jgi:glycosyltransferase involved in cell wall biosynthesis
MLLGTIGLYPVNIVNTAFTRSEFDRYPGRYRRNLKLIEHGVERPVIHRTRAETLARYGIPDDRRILLNTGRLAAQKNQDTIIRALPRLPDCRLVVAGDGALKDEYLALARSLGLADRVHLLGARPHGEALQLYGAVDLFVFPSVHETFGISGVEAALLGIPTIVADIPVLREVLTIEGSNVVRFVPPMDVDGWSAAIAAEPRPLAEREAFAAALGRRYSEQRMIDAYVELLTRPVR